MGAQDENNHDTESGSRSAHTKSKEGGEGDGLREAAMSRYCQGAEPRRTDAFPQAETNPWDPGLLHSGKTYKSLPQAAGSFDHSHDSKPRSCILLRGLRRSCVQTWKSLQPYNIFHHTPSFFTKAGRYRQPASGGLIDITRSYASVWSLQIGHYSGEWS